MKRAGDLDLLHILFNVFTVWAQCDLDRFLHVSRASRHHRGMFSLENISCLILYMTLKFCIVDIFCNALRDRCYLIRLMNALLQLWNELTDDWFRVFKFPPCCYLIFDKLHEHIFQRSYYTQYLCYHHQWNIGKCCNKIIGKQFVFFGAAQYVTYLPSMEFQSLEALLSSRRLVNPSSRSNYDFLLFNV